MASPPNPIDFIRRLQALRPDRIEREPVVIPPVEQLSEEYDREFGDGPALSQYRDHIQSMPEYEDYKPSFGRRLVAGLVGAGLGARSPQQGIQFAESTVNKPYHEAISRWNMETAPLRESASLEEMGNRTKRRYIDDARETALRQQKQSIDEDTKFNEFDRKLLDLERSFYDNQSRAEDRDADRAARVEDNRQRQLDRDSAAEDRRTYQQGMLDVARGNLDARRNPPPRPTAPLRTTPERYRTAYGQAMKELTDNPNMADFIDRKNGKFIGFKESAGGLFTAKRKPNLTLNGKSVTPAEWVKARTDAILAKMKEDDGGQFEDLGFEP